MMNTVRIVLGWIMIGISAFLVGNLVWSGGSPKTQSIWLDIAFAAVFMLRGVMNLRAKRRPVQSTER